jgi:hypothetical protein
MFGLFSRLSGFYGRLGEASLPVQFQLGRRLGRPGIYLVVGTNDTVRAGTQQLTKCCDVQAVMPRPENGQVLFRQPKQTHGGPQTPSMFGMQRVLEIFLQMHEGPRSLDQALEEIVVLRVLVQPKLLQNVVRLIVTLSVPASKICPVTRMICDRSSPNIGIFAFQLAHESRNPLAFTHEGLNLTTARMMGKFGCIDFPGKASRSVQKCRRSTNHRMNRTGSREPETITFQIRQNLGSLGDHS